MEAKLFLETIIFSLVLNKEAVIIEQKEDELWTLLTLKLDPTDMGTIIGRGGKTIDAIRTVLRVFGSKMNLRVNLKLIEDKPIL